MERCISCNKLQVNHTNEERDNCIRKRKFEKNTTIPHRRTWLRLHRIGSIIREFEQCTKFQLAKALEYEEIPTGLPTIDKLLPTILEMNPAIHYKDGLFYVVSLSPEYQQKLT